MAKLLSYLYPITKKIKSEINGTLEITWYNGKKHLNSKNANYSYGSLQRILKFGLEKLDLKNVNSILVLGLGGGSVIETLRKDFKYQNQITAVDIDPQIIAIAKNEFQIETSKNLNIICDDALHYIENTSDTFDLIIIDLFIDLMVPAQFLDLSFWETILKRKSASGSILFNASLEKELSQKLEHIISYLKSHIYQVDVHKKVNQTNTVVIAKAL
ncbi:MULTISPECIES: spermidine synthase [Bizionia]|uniref:Methyltransferase domain-containing protein n=1 Tax=Bizionia algoritergicola TaxID=291187 RepID=A0A5D0R3X9_9FLAO|nr:MULTISPECIES: fused MFS/spermidine synthase [Bizionia]OBX24407.1 spermine synthase [Bizionia sp. APA-3]TYB75328.1 methyltransferase domain-containing protein [Bizionia algoritergicola]